MEKSMEQREDYPTNQINNMKAEIDESEEEMMKFPRTCSLTNLLDMDYMGPISHLLSDGSYNSTFEFQINTAYGGIDPFVKSNSQMVEIPTNSNTYGAGSEKYHVKQNSSNSPMIFNQIYDHRD